MTDEGQVQTLVDAAFQEGYRAGLEEVAKEVAALKKISYLGRTGDDDCDDLLRWLNAKLKEQP